MKRWAEIWSSFPAAHKKRGIQGLAVYGAALAVTAVWLGYHAHDTAQSWKSRTPSASATIKSVYLTPQIDASASAGADTSTINLDAAQPVVDDGKTYVAIIVSDLGLSSLATERALNDLPSQVTLAFSPYGDNVSTWVSKAIAARHETLMLMPMETANYPAEDPGPKALSSRFSDADNDENLNWLLSEGRGSVGVINLMGSRFMTDKKRVTSAFRTLRENNALFVEAPGIDKSAAPGVASGLGLPYMSANLIIDAVATDRDIRAQLDALEKTAREKGYAVGIAQPYPLTMNIIKEWSAGLQGRGITLAPLKTIWKNKPHHDYASQPPAGGTLRQPGQQQ